MRGAGAAATRASSVGRISSKRRSAARRIARRTYGSSFRGNAVISRRNAYSASPSRPRRASRSPRVDSTPGCGGAPAAILVAARSASVRPSSSRPCAASACASRRSAATLGRAAGPAASRAAVSAAFQSPRRPATVARTSRASRGFAARARFASASARSRRSRSRASSARSIASPSASSGKRRAVSSWTASASSGSPEPAQDVGELVADVDEIGLLAEEPDAEGERLLEPSLVGEGETALDLAEHRDPRLGIGQRSVGGLGGGSEVAERRESRQLLGARRRRRREGERNAIELGLALRPLAPPVGAQVAPLAGVGREVVELRIGTVDRVPALVGERAELAPAEVQSGIERLRVDPPRGRLGAGEREERDTGRLRRRLGAGERGRGRVEVDQRRGRGHALAGALAAGQLEDQRHVQRFAVEEHAVLRFAVVAEAFAVVREDEDRRPLVLAALPQAVEEAAERGVGGGDLAVVRIGEARPERLGRGVRRVWLEQVDEQEPGAALSALLRAVEPAQGRVHRLDARALQLADGRGFVHLQLVVVGGEAGREAGLAPQHVSRDRGAGGVAGLAEQRRQRAVTGGVEAEADVAPHADVGREPAGQQRSVRRQGERHLRPGVLEPDPLAHERREPGRRAVGVAPVRQAVGAQGVDRDEEDRRPRPLARATREGRQGREDRDDRERGEGADCGTVRAVALTRRRASTAPARRAGAGRPPPVRSRAESSGRRAARARDRRSATPPRRG